MCTDRRLGEIKTACSLRKASIIYDSDYSGSVLPVGKPYIMKLENGYLDCR